MVKRILLFLTVAIALNTTGCGVARQHESRGTNDKLMQIETGMDKSAVLSILGNPYKREVYENNEFLIYDTNHWAKNEDERFTPIYLRDGKVVGWGRNYYDSIPKSKIEADVHINQ